MSARPGQAPAATMTQHESDPNGRRRDIQNDFKLLRFAGDIGHSPRGHNPRGHSPELEMEKARNTAPPHWMGPFQVLTRTAPTPPSKNRVEPPATRPVTPAVTVINGFNADRLRPRMLACTGGAAQRAGTDGRPAGVELIKFKTRRTVWSWWSDGRAATPGPHTTRGSPQQPDWQCEETVASSLHSDLAFRAAVGARHGRRVPLLIHLEPRVGVM